MWRGKVSGFQSKVQHLCGIKLPGLVKQPWPGPGNFGRKLWPDFLARNSGLKLWLEILAHPRNLAPHDAGFIFCNLGFQAVATFRRNLLDPVALYLEAAARSTRAV